MANQSERYCDAVLPAPAELDRPRWSVMIPTFNCARFLGGALKSVLMQDPGPEAMQIEVVDDGSVDDPEGIVRQVGGDRIRFFRQQRNVGHIANFQTCLKRARGELVHLLHGDDLVRPGFYEALQHGFDASPEVGAAFCRSIYIDGNGNELSRIAEEQGSAGLLHDALFKIATEQRIMTPSIAVRRSVYELLGGFDRRLTCSEDWEMWVRIAASFPIWYEPRALALYRIHGASNTGRHTRNATDIAFTRLAISLFEAHLPESIAKQATAMARRTYAETALSNANHLLSIGDLRGFFMQVKEAARLAPSLRVSRRALGILVRHSTGIRRG